VDNATGCGILLELAPRLVAAPKPPAALHFVRSRYRRRAGFARLRISRQHLSLPASKVTLDLNYDAIFPIGDPEEIEITGAERTTFYPQVEKTAEKFDWAIRADSQPEAGHYYRSDHFSLARVGIPSFFNQRGREI